MEDKEVINSNILKSQLNKRGIEIKTEKTFAGNDIRFFVHKGQKIYFDTETNLGGTTFAWSEEQTENLLFLLDNVTEENQGIFLEMDGHTQLCFNWGMKEYMIPINFRGYYKIFEGKVCEEIGL